ncbi:hypothetical protein [Saccharopolyspora hattusasensis]|uniref:hypothetical protein n=1 Tax=Saccharopolyspora hattusasensis TaxID=1128679 RepID=UPI003D9802E2
MGVTQLVCGDVLRPDPGWLMVTAAPSQLGQEMARVRDPDGFAALAAARQASAIGYSTAIPALERVAIILAAKGGQVRDITPGDCLELLETSYRVFPGPITSSRHSPFFYQLLHAVGVFSPEAPPTVRMFNPRFQGQLSAEQLIDRYQLACRPVRDLLVDYLRERQPSVDYNTLTGLATALGLWPGHVRGACARGRRRRLRRR